MVVSEDSVEEAVVSDAVVDAAADSVVSNAAVVVSVTVSELLCPSDAAHPVSKRESASSAENVFFIMFPPFL